ncbi:NADPH oxidase regulator NoxR [Mycena sanguinolenta]|nr:NADPH oxidase regulator NoxR [Mycena sanguinolenta]
MSLKAELETWAAALKAYDEEDFEKSLDLFSGIADSSKILTNMGLIYATLGDHEAAVERFNEATGLDTYLAVAYFQCGVSNFLLARYELAHKDFEEALLYLRGNQAMWVPFIHVSKIVHFDSSRYSNYEQLGLRFRLFSAEVLFNQGLSLIYMGRTEEGLADMEEAKRAKATEEHNVIDDAITDRGEGYTVFSIPVGVLYRPAEKKLVNAKSKDYMGKAKLIAASDARDTTVGFSGIDRLNQGLTPNGGYIDGGQSALARSNTRAPPARKDDDETAPPLSRSKTTLNVVSKPSGGDDGALAGSPAGGGPARSNTVLNTARASPNAGMGGPVRGASVRRGGSPPAANKPLPGGPPPPAKDEPDPSRLTAFYDNYLDSYTDEPVPPMPNAPEPDRIAAWAQSNANGAPATPPSAFVARSGSRSAPTSSYAPSSFGGESVRRRVTRRNTRRIQSAYEEEEEGYASGEDFDVPFELIKIRVKLHYDDDIRGMALAPETPFEEFMDKVTAKFGRGLTLKFTDEDGGKVSLRDESDYELAIETARESSKGKPEGKLEIWCMDA